MLIVDRFMEKKQGNQSKGVAIFTGTGVMERMWMEGRNIIRTYYCSTG
jgi:hypothetical protein